jgi:hypothetical protein
MISRPPGRTLRARQIKADIKGMKGHEGQKVLIFFIRTSLLEAVDR